MKKLFIFGATSIGTLVSAKFPFRTSCGTVVNVKDTEGASTAELTNFLKYVNYAECGTVPSGITIYAH